MTYALLFVFLAGPAVGQDKPDWARAASLYESVLQGQPRHPPAVMGLGRAREGLNL